MAITLYKDREFYVVQEDTKKEYLIPTGNVGFVNEGSDVIVINYDPISTSRLSWRGAASDVLNANGVSYGSTVEDVVNGVNVGVDVNIQDQTTQPIDDYFLQELSAFTISTDATPSDISTLSYDFDATTGHGIAVNDEVLLLDVAADRSFYATVLGVAVDVITVDRPIDHAFASATTLGRIVSSEMAVNGSVTPQIFTVRAGITPSDIVRFILTVRDDVEMDDAKFGGITALTRGLVLRVIDGTQKTIFNYKNNQDMKQFAYDLSYADKAKQGEFGLSTRTTFGGQSKHGVTIRLSGNDRLQFIVQDDLTDLISIRAAVQGHQVE